MGDLFRLNWQAFDPTTGLKAAVGALLIFGLMHVTGETWIATGLILLFAWLTNVPGTLKARVGGMVAFAVGAIALTLLSGWLGLGLWANIVAITVIGFVCTLPLAWSTRAYMVGYVLICWAIYGPFLIASTSVTNCVLAILVGSGAIILTTLIGSLFEKDTQAEVPTNSDEASSQAPGYEFVLPYAITIALVLGLTTYIGWVTLKTDPTMVVGGAFFIIGFDAKKTWVAGIARVVGIIAGILLGAAASQVLPPGLVTDVVVIAAFFLCFAAGGIHPALFMLFFMFIISIGWSSLEPEMLNLTFQERILGEGVGVVIAMLAIGYLHWLQTRKAQ